MASSLLTETGRVQRWLSYGETDWTVCTFLESHPSPRLTGQHHQAQLSPAFKRCFGTFGAFILCFFNSFHSSRWLRAGCADTLSDGENVHLTDVVDPVTCPPPACQSGRVGPALVHDPALLLRSPACQNREKGESSSSAFLPFLGCGLLV
jgi:hypothetical protein